MEGKCVQCDQVFEKRHLNQQFCTRSCYNKGVVILPAEPDAKDFRDWAEQFRPEWLEEWRMRRGSL